MNIEPIIWMLIALAMASGLVAGVFLTFSDFVMKSLFASAPAAGTDAMQIINRKVYQSIFMILLMGLIPVTGLVALYAQLVLTGPAVALLTIAGLTYFLGVFIVSAVGNIPMNQALEAFPQGGTAAQNYWPDYVHGWVLWNHVRWVSSLTTSTCYVIAAVLLAKGG